MMQHAASQECAAVRDALLSGSFDEVSREQVEQHLRSHAACVQWAAQVLLLTHLAAGERGPYEAGTEISQSLLEAYLDGKLPEAEHHTVEEACCHDLAIAGRLAALRQERWQRRLQVLDSDIAVQLFQALPPRESAALVAPLEEFRGLYLYKPLAVAAAQAQRSTFQTPDGSFVVSVVDKGAGQPGEPRAIELGIRVHQPKWIGSWACYRVTDARGHLAAAGLVLVEEHGSTVRVSVPPTEHAPYTVQVQVLDVGTSKLQEMFEQIVAQSDSGSVS